MPKVRPIPSTVACMITLESAEGVPLPEDSDEFKREQVVGRSVRIGLYDTRTDELVYNAVHVNAIYDKS